MRSIFESLTTLRTFLRNPAIWQHGRALCPVSSTKPVIGRLGAKLIMGRRLEALGLWASTARGTHRDVEDSLCPALIIVSQIDDEPVALADTEFPDQSSGDGYLNAVSTLDSLHDIYYLHHSPTP